eukprot:TRINITY_DN61040_c0_g1_i1.p1 TRINITY_DN61040_c0_g1~~TRINITY_DN61040_c0_g1_i1.p1  ORF type:complete len:720 (-),score=93.52 TRINITY_DN61040_c0_g1_i1:285-2444(-)
MSSVGAMEMSKADDLGLKLKLIMTAKVESSMSRLQAELSREIQNAFDREVLREVTGASNPLKVKDEFVWMGPHTSPESLKQKECEDLPAEPTINFDIAETGVDKAGLHQQHDTSTTRHHHTKQHQCISAAGIRYDLDVQFDRLVNYAAHMPFNAVVYPEHVLAAIAHTITHQPIEFRRLAYTLEHISHCRTAVDTCHESEVTFRSSVHRSSMKTSIDRDLFLSIMNGDLLERIDSECRAAAGIDEDADELLVAVYHDVCELKRLFQEEADHHEADSVLDKLRIAVRRPQSHHVSLEVVPAIVIVLNAVVLGLSQDYATEHIIWNILEICFVVFYTVELFVKLHVFGCKRFFHNDITWDYWNCFDLVCLVASLVDLSVTIAIELSEQSQDANAFMLLKIFRVGRLARLVRTINNPVFAELKIMLLGVLAGLRTLLWAFVLLVLMVYILGVTMRIFVGNQREEFQTVQIAMFTLFRCFIDDCVTLRGTPLTQELYLMFGPIYALGYVTVTMLVTMGIFNLITAVFIDNVALSQNHRRQVALADSLVESEARLKKIVSHFVITNGMLSKDKQVMTTLEALGTKSVDDIFDLLESTGFEVSRELFATWMSDDTFVDILTENDIECANKSELFDVLDADTGQTLTLSEVITGLMMLRGPVTKGDITTITLKVRYVSGMVDRLLAAMSNLEDRASSFRLSSCDGVRNSSAALQSVDLNADAVVSV